MTAYLGNDLLAGKFAARRIAVTRIMALCGWVCDRYTDAGMRGAALLACRAAERLGLPWHALGEREPPAELGWRTSLAKATPYLRDIVTPQINIAMARGNRPMIFANRCSVSLATIASALRHRPDAKVVWFDAHGDFNTPANTPTGYLGGMVLSALCGLWDSGLGSGLSPDRLILAGPRDLDPAEKAELEEKGVCLILPRNGHIDAAELVRAVDGAPVWLHIDTDVVDPSYIPAEYRVPHGVAPDEMRCLLAALMRTSDLVGFELTEFEAPRDAVLLASAEDRIMKMIEPVLAFCSLYGEADTSRGWAA
jgi:arginase/N-omega-hydroxy-L-arginine amidinohydrolase